MGKVRARKDTGMLYFDFLYQKQRCREYTKLKNMRQNIVTMEKMMKRIDAEITMGTFDYQRYFPNSKMNKRLAQLTGKNESDGNTNSSPTFSEFAEEWLFENEIRWKRSYAANIQVILNNYLLKRFGEKKVSYITKGEILKFRSSLAKVTNGSRLSPDRINHIMTPLRMILADAADRYDFTTPFNGLKQLPVAQSQVDPFSLKDVWLFLNNVRSDFRNYYLVRFFTGMRTSEIDGLKWKYVDFERREILIRETLVKGHIETTKTAGSARAIQMSEPVYQALLKHKSIADKNCEYVFCNSKGAALNYSNVSSRIWYPTLKQLGIKRRRPYQTRHTAATLWLAAGETPEWIARQMGHTTTKMLFTIYSRFVPNLTHNDGSAFERLLAADSRCQQLMEVS